MFLPSTETVTLLNLWASTRVGPSSSLSLDKDYLASKAQFGPLRPLERGHAMSPMLIPTLLELLVLLSHPEAAGMLGFHGLLKQGSGRGHSVLYLLNE